jgi:hypothetical protein
VFINEAESFRVVGNFGLHMLRFAGARAAEDVFVHGRRPSDVKRRWLRNKTFSDKMQKCKQLAKDEGDAELWDVLKAANQLRNTIAHTLSIEKIAEKMEQLKERYFAFLTEKQAADLKGRPDDYIAQSALVTCAGFIATLQDRARAKKSADAS